MEHVVFVVKAATRSFSVTLGVLATAPSGQRAVRAGALSQATGAQRKTAIRAALVAAGLDPATPVLIVEAAPPVGCRVVTTSAPTTEPEAPKAEEPEAPKAESRKEWLTPATGDGTAWLAAYRAIVAANKGKVALVYRDCHAEQVACGTKWLDWARSHGIFAKNPVKGKAAPKAAKPAKPWSKQAVAHAKAEQAAANVAALAAGLPAAVKAPWLTAVYKAAYNFGQEAQGLPHRYEGAGIDAPAMPVAVPAKKAA
jgi:hypothetical protein